METAVLKYLLPIPASLVSTTALSGLSFCGTEPAWTLSRLVSCWVRRHGLGGGVAANHGNGCQDFPTDRSGDFILKARPPRPSARQEDVGVYPP